MLETMSQSLFCFGGPGSVVRGGAGRDLLGSNDLFDGCLTNEKMGGTDRHNEKEMIRVRRSKDRFCRKEKKLYL
jgi:hypothetical protein